jgi:hypothetical protein
MKRRAVVAVAVVAVAAGGIAVAPGLHSLNGETPVSEIVNGWGPSTAFVACNYLNPNETSLETTASGTFLREGAHDYVLTTVHALADGSASPVSCDVELPNAADVTVLPGDISVDANGFDVEELPRADMPPTSSGGARRAPFRKRG